MQRDGISAHERTGSATTLRRGEIPWYSRTSSGTAAHGRWLRMLAGAADTERGALEQDALGRRRRVLDGRVQERCVFGIVRERRPWPKQSHHGSRSPCKPGGMDPRPHPRPSAAWTCILLQRPSRQCTRPPAVPNSTDGGLSPAQPVLPASLMCLRHRPPHRDRRQRLHSTAGEPVSKGDITMAAP
jgi:hypothetical protein